MYYPFNEMVDGDITGHTHGVVRGDAQLVGEATKTHVGADWAQECIDWWSFLNKMIKNTSLLYLWGASGNLYHNVPTFKTYVNINSCISLFKPVDL